MKKLAIITLLIVFSCQPPEKQEEPKSKSFEEPLEDAVQRDALTGAWSMSSFYTINNSTGDTTFIDRTQYKLYVDGNVMWGFEQEKGLPDFFGYGTYSVDGDTLREVMTSGSNAFREILKERKDNRSWAMDINVFGDSYTQIYQDGDEMVYEVYDRL